MLLELSYLTYLVITIAITIWVARTLSSNGLVWLIDAFDGNDALANSINHMLVVGFYLINLGYVSLALRFGSKPSDLAGAIEFLSTKIGLVLIIVGIMHFILMRIITRWGKRAAKEWDPSWDRREAVNTADV